MALSSKRRILLAKIESVYGTDSTPTGSNALIVSNLDVSPMEAETVERDLIRPYFGQAERLMTQTYAKASFEIELAGHSAGIIGNKPAIDALLQASGFAGTQNTTAISMLTRSSTTATATIGTHSYAVGDQVEISGAVETEYNGVQTITAKTSTTFSYTVSGTPSTPATGSPVMKASYEYNPISTAIPSVTMYYIVDGVLHKLTGCKGTFSVDISVKAIPKFKFEFTGINNDPSDSAAPSPDFSSFTIPQVANTQNTSNFSLLGYGGALESFAFALNNAVTYVTLIGDQYVEVLDRKVSGNMSFQAPTIATKDYWTAVKDQTTGALSITHGSQNSNIVDFAFQRILLDSPKYKESNNVMMMTAGVSIMPVDGNDEMVMTFK